MRRFFKIIAMLSMIYGSCNFSKAVEKDTQKRIVAHKDFLRDLSFRGTIHNKVNCNECEGNKYQIEVNLDEYLPKNIALSNQSFEPYYSLDTNSKVLNIAVTKSVFDSVKIGLPISKKSASNNFLVEGHEYDWLSNEKYKILP